MKQKKLNKKLVIKRVTIATLNNKEQFNIRGGDTVHGRTCDEGTVLGPTCESSPIETCS